MKYDVNFLPARYGDCILIEYGKDSKTCRVLIDGGTGGTKENIRKIVEALPEDERHFELMVITHIDRDHIEGVLSLLEEDELAFSVDDLWFNGWKHLPENEDETLGAMQGERLTAAITKHNISWNDAFGKKAVV